MNTIFIGGSRHVSRLPIDVKTRLDNVVASGHQVIVGDANGADKAVQKHLLDRHYDKVTVFCSGDTPRNNLAPWPTRRIDAPKGARGFQFYAAKDREMAREADFGLMIWDGKSPGTVLNVLRLVKAGKISVLFNVAEKAALNIKSSDQWKSFLARCGAELRSDLKARATPEEWAMAEGNIQPSLISSPESPCDAAPARMPEAPGYESLQAASHEAIKLINRALADGDASTIMNALGGIARERGMSQVARDTGLARESLYRSLDAGGNPEFATVMKVLSSVGLRLEAKAIDAIPEPALAPVTRVG